MINPCIGLVDDKAVNRTSIAERSGSLKTLIFVLLQWMAAIAWNSWKDCRRKNTRLISWILETPEMDGVKSHQYCKGAKTRRYFSWYSRYLDDEDDKIFEGSGPGPMDIY